MPLIESGSANLAPKVTNVNPTTSLFAAAGSGGGGGAGTDPVVSTITVAASINTVNGVAFNNLASGNTTDANLLFDPGNNFNAWQVFNPGVADSYVMNMVVADAGNAALTAYNGNTNAPIGMSILASTVTFQGDSGVYMSTLNVSSINGATPGGGGGSIPPTIQLSTIQFGDAGAGFGVLDVTGVNQLLIQNTLTSANDFQFYTNYQATATPGTAIVAVAPNTNTGINIVTQNSGQNDILITGNYPLNITASTISHVARNTSISSLTVSSINGASYPPPSSAYPVVSTITQAGGGSQVQFYTSTNAVVQLGSALSTVIGHNYQITFPYGMTPGSSPSYQDVLTFSYQPDGVGGTPLLYTQPILPNGFARIPFTYKARLGTGGVSFAVEANTSYPVLITLDNLEGTTLVDLGPST